MTTRRSLLMPALAVIAAAVAGCSNASAGSPTAVPTTSSAGSPVASINPCSLLTAANIQQLGLIDQKPTDTSTSRGCSWTKTGNYTVGIDLRDHTGLDDAQSASAKNIGSHAGVQFMDQFGCTVALGITNSSRVDFGVSTGDGDTTMECDLAAQYAALVEPTLPAERK